MKLNKRIKILIVFLFCNQQKNNFLKLLKRISNKKIVKQKIINVNKYYKQIVKLKVNSLGNFSAGSKKLFV